MNSLDYVKGTKPYTDFAICSLNFFAPDSFEEKVFNNTCKIILDRGTDFSGSCFFSGVANFDNKYISYSELNDSILDGGCVGNFTAFKILTNEKIDVFNDIFGMGIVYYYYDGDKFIISNRYHLILRILNESVIPMNLNYNKVISSLASEGSFFMQNFSEEMDVENTYQLQIDSYISIEDGVFKLKEKSSFLSLLHNEEDVSYSQLLDDACNEIVNNTKVVLKDKSINNIIFDLTGGFDSRLCLSSLLSLDCEEDLKDRISFITRDVANSKDLEISCGLVDLFKGKYFVETDATVRDKPVSIAESINLWRTMYMGSYHRMGLSRWSRRGENSFSVRISGGCGEIYRSFWYKMYKRFILDGSSTRDVVSEILKLDNVEKRLSEDDYDVVISYLVNQIDNLPGLGVKEKLDNHYLYYRNRYHFGMNFLNFYHDKPVWSPLMSKSLFKASNVISFDDRVSGKAIIEVMERLNPIFPWIEFDSGYKPDGSEEFKFNCFKGMNFKMNKEKSNWEKTEAYNKEYNKNRRKSKQTSKEFNLEWKNLSSHLKDEIDVAMDNIVKYDARFDKHFDTIYRENISSLYNNKHSNFFILASKILSISDQIDLLHKV